MNGARYRAVGRSLLVLATSTMLAHGITMLASPILTRLYSPEDFGLVAIFFAISLTIRAMATLQYEAAIPVKADDVLAGALTVLSFAILCVFCIATTSLTQLFGEEIAILMSAPDVRNYLWLVPFVVFVLATDRICQAWAIRRKSFGRISKAEITQSVSTVAVQTAFGLANWTPLGLFLGRLAGMISSSLVYVVPLLPAARVRRQEINLGRILTAARREWRFPAFAGPSELLRVLSAQSPSVLLAWSFGPEVLGLYVLTDRVLQIPFAFVAEHVRRVFLSVAVEARREGTIHAVTEVVFQTLLCVSLPLFAVFAIAAPDLFSLIFGERWRDAGHYAAILSPVLFVSFITGPLSPITMIFDRQRGELLFQAILLVSRVASLVSGGMLLDPRSTIIIFSAAGTTCWLGFMLWVLSVAGCRARRVFSLTSREVICSLPFVAPLLVVGHVPALAQYPEYTTAAASIICGAFALAFSVLRLKHFALRMA